MNTGLGEDDGDSSKISLLFPSRKGVGEALFVGVGLTEGSGLLELVGVGLDVADRLGVILLLGVTDGVLLLLGRRRRTFGRKNLRENLSKVILEVLREFTKHVVRPICTESI